MIDYCSNLTHVESVKLTEDDVGYCRATVSPIQTRAMSQQRTTLLGLHGITTAKGWRRINLALPGASGDEPIDHSLPWQETEETADVLRTIYGVFDREYSVTVLRKNLD